MAGNIPSRAAKKPLNEAASIPSFNPPRSIEVLAPFKCDEVSDFNEKQAYDSRNQARCRRIEKSDHTTLFRMPREAHMFNQFWRFTSQLVRSTKIPDPLPPGRLPNLHDLDVVFVAIVFKDFWNIGPSEIGIATLDTRDLDMALLKFQWVPVTKKSQSLTLHHLIRSRHVYGNYNAQSTDKFLFGATEHVPLVKGTARASILKNSLFIRDRDSPNAFRNIVLVGHAFYTQLDHMSSRGMDADTLSHVVGILDTARIARALQGHDNLKWTQEWPSLCLLLELSHCPYSELQVAGNNAHFTLRALLLLVTKCSRMLTLDSVEKRLVEGLEEIARIRLPESALQQMATNIPKHEPRIKRKPKIKGKPLDERRRSTDWADSLSSLTLVE